MSIDYKEAYLKWLSENIEQDQIGEDVYRVTLPYLNRNNDYIDLYVVRREDGLYRITDDGWTISDLSLSGFELKLSTSRRTILDSVLASYGVSLSDESEMFVESSLDELALKKHMLSQCMLKVDDMFYLSKTNVQSVFSEDVRQFLDLKNVRYLESVSFVGKSKLPANYDFGIPKSKKYPERLIKIRSSIASIFDYSTLAGLVCLILVGVLILVAAIYFVVKALLRRQTLSTDFHDVMLQNTAGTLREAVYPGSFSWGEGKTVKYCPNIIDGWKPENIILKDYNATIYAFYKAEEAPEKYGEHSLYPTQEGWVEYRNSANFRKIIERGNNLPRVMLTGQELNYNKNDRKLLLSLQLTEWSQTSYVWDFFGKKQGTEISGNNLMNEYAKGISDGKQALEYLPNSLCMHLMIETMDNKLIKSRISESKKNDNPGTWAFTLGEQLDPGDVRDDTNLHADFMQRWMRRAFLEEYKMNDNSYADIVDADSLRILSLDFESDRYNFALLCVVRLNYSYKTFSEKIYSTLDREEAREIGSLDLDEIPGILATYNTKDKNGRHTARGQYHPSSYLRLLMYYIHRKGIGRAEQEIEKYMREAK